MNKLIVYTLILVQLILFSCSRVKEDNPLHEKYLEAVEREKKTDKFIRRAHLDYDAINMEKENLQKNREADERESRNNPSENALRKSMQKNGTENQVKEVDYPLEYEFKNGNDNILNDLDRDTNTNENNVEPNSGNINRKSIKNNAKRKAKKAPKSKTTKQQNSNKLNYDSFKKRKDRTLDEINKIKKAQKTIIIDSTKNNVKKILEKNNRLKKRLGFD